MSTLIQVSEHCYYLPGATKAGVVQTAPHEAWLIDSGNDKSTARALLRELTARDWQLRGILNTHSHADHIGGNNYLQSRTLCRIYAPEIEQAFTCHPILEPSFLYGGNPTAALRNKFLMAQPSRAELLSPEVLPPGVGVIPLPGHSYNMVGYRTQDNVVYLADSVAAPATLQKYRICFLYDVAAYLRTLDMLESLQAQLFIPAHAEPTDDLRALTRCNREHIHELAENIVTLCSAAPLSADELVTRLYRRWQLPLSMEQYVLAGSTLRSYLTWLSENGRLAPICSDERLLWAKV